MAKSIERDGNKIAQRDTEKPFQRDLAREHRSLDPTMSKGLRQLVTATQITGFFDPPAYLRSNPQETVVAVIPDHTTAADVESELGHQLQFHGKDEPANPVPAEVTHYITENPQPDTPGEQDLFSQHSERKPFHEALKSRSEILIETAPRSIVASPFAFLREKTSQTAPGAHEVEWRPVIDQVVGEINGRMLVGNKEAFLQLDPPELGKLRIDLYVEGDKLVARILTESQESRALIETHLPELRQALGENRMELVDVRVDNLNWDGRGGNSQQGARQGASDGRPGHNLNDRSQSDVAKGEPSERSKSGRAAGRVSVWA
jgi:hypothetical protein